MNINAGNITAKARVTVELEITVSSTWGTGCSIEQIHKQSNEEAIGILKNLLQKSDGRVRALGGETIKRTSVEILP